MPAYDAIGFLSGAGIISGYQDGNFGPTDTLKRGQATKMLVLWQGVTPVTALADRKNALAAAMSRFSLSLTSTRAPERSMAR